MSPYTTPSVVSVSGSNARVEGRGCGGAVIGAGSAASAMVGPTEGPCENTLAGRPNASQPCVGRLISCGPAAFAPLALRRASPSLARRTRERRREGLRSQPLPLPPPRATRFTLSAMTGRLALAAAALLVSIAAHGVAARAAQARDPAGLKATYVKRELFIPMRDGVKLFTIIYTPRDTTQRYPFLMTRTAYGIAPYGPDDYRAVLGPHADFAREGYIFVYQDARGKFKSEGEFVHHVPYVKGSSKPNEVTDTYDTIDWLVKNVPNNNGRAGQWGISWGGWEVSQGMIDAHPALKASSPQSPPQDQFLGDDHHSGGAFQLMYAFSWMSDNARARSAPTDQPPGRFDYGSPDGYDFFMRLGSAASAREFFADEVPTWNDYMIHGTYDDYWQSRNVPKD